ncbi:meiosis-specific component of sister chromatid cohesion complex [Mactra antiquata]
MVQKRGGKFSKVWLAATHMCKLTRREVASINIEKKCNEIESYVNHEVPASVVGGRRPRFSLYLSSQLMYGAVRIYHKQAFYLLEDVESALVKLKTSPLILQNIDLADLPSAEKVTLPEVSSQQDSDLPEMFSDLQRESFLNEFEFNDRFWAMNGMNGATLPVVEEEKQDVSRRKRKKKQTDLNSPVPSVTRDQITLQEVPPLLMDTPLSPIQVPKEMDLPILDGEGLALLMDTNFEEPPLRAEDLIQLSTPIQSDRNTMLHSVDGEIQQNEQEKTPDRIQAMEIPEDRAIQPSPGITQIITSPSPRRAPARKSLQLELTPITPSPLRQKRKRHLAFADTHTQIPKAQMRRNMTTTSDTCVPFMIPYHNNAASDLLTIPGDKAIRVQPWLGLWERKAVFRRNIPESDLAEAVSPVRDIDVDEQGMQPEEQGMQPEQGMLDEDQGMQHEEQRMQHEETLPDMSGIQPMEESAIRVESPIPQQIGKKRKRSTLEQTIEEMRATTSMSELVQEPIIPDISSTEVHRSASQVSLDKDRDLHITGTSMEGSLLLDESGLSRKERSLRRSRSSMEEIQVTPRQHQPSFYSTAHTSTAPTLYEVIEEPRFEEPFTVIPYTASISADDFFNKIQDDTMEDGVTTFYKLCPPQLVDKAEAANKFTALLDLCRSGKIVADQKRSYGEIYIRLTE